MNTVADCLRRHYRVVVFAVYLAVVIVTMAFHEPWFDEAQSWLIARDCPYRDLLLVRPHYEGYLPLWWLLLSIPAATRQSFNLCCSGRCCHPKACSLARSSDECSCDCAVRGIVFDGLDCARTDCASTWES